MEGLPLVPVIILAVGVFDLILATAFYLYLEGLRRRNEEVRRKWRSVPVRILASRLTEWRGKKSTLYSAEIRYEYTVDGTRYESGRISVYPVWSTSHLTSPQQLVADHPAGRECSGFVNPRNPKEAVLTSVDGSPEKMRLLVFILIGSGLFTMVAGAIAWVFGGDAQA